jgi:hypothetical protein
MLCDLGADTSRVEDPQRLRPPHPRLDRIHWRDSPPPDTSRAEDQQRLRPPPARDVAQYSATWHCGLSSPWHYATGATRALRGAWCTRREPPDHPHACAGPLSHALKNHLHPPAHGHCCYFARCLHYCDEQIRTRGLVDTDLPPSCGSTLSSSPLRPSCCSRRPPTAHAILAVPPAHLG